MSEPLKTNWILIAAIFVSGLFAAAQFGKLTLTLEVMQDTYPNVRAWVPSLVSIVGIVGLIFGVVAGGFISRIGMSRALLWALVGGGAMSLVQSLLPPVGLFALTRVVEGFSHLGLVIAGPTLIASVSSEADRPVAMGIWAAFFGASIAITAAFLPGILAQGGVAMLFSLHGFGMFIAAAVLWMILPVNAPETPERLGFVQTYQHLYTSPRLMLPGVGFVWYTGIYIALLAVLPIALDLPASVIAIIPLVSIAGTIGAGVVAKFVVPHHLLSAGFVASSVLMVVMWIGLNGNFVIYALFFLMGAIPTGAFSAIAHFNVTTTTRAQATGGITHFGNIGTTLGTPLMVLAYQGAGLTGVTAMVVICCLGGLISILKVSAQIR